MARLWNSNRKLDGGYSLEALSSSADAMSECAEMLGAGAEMMRAKRGMKKIFGKPKLKKDGTPEDDDSSAHRRDSGGQRIP